MLETCGAWEVVLRGGFQVVKIVEGEMKVLLSLIVATRYQVSVFRLSGGTRWCGGCGEVGLGTVIRNVCRMNG